MAIQDITEPILFGGGYVKRLSSSLGFNSSPSSLEIEFIVDDTGQISSPQTFVSGDVNPSNISGLSVNNFKFMGVIHSWNKQYSTAGITYTCRIVDPRIVFSDVHLIANGKGPLLPSINNIVNGTGIYNIINVWDYYGNDSSGQYNQHGMPWNKIKTALEATGLVTVYNKQFKLDFDDGFIAPDYYRINGDEYSLESCINTASYALGLDYFVEIDYDTYNPTGLVNTINIRSVQRQPEATGLDIDGYLQSKQAEKTLVSYTRGRELRNGPTDVLLLGANKKYMQTFVDTFPSYGRTSDGRVLTGADNSTSLGASFKPLDDPDRHSGYVILENIVTSNPTLLSSLPTMSPEGRTRFLTNASYPPGVYVDDITNAIVGYRPTENVMRAALFSQESWEAILYKEQPTVADQLNIEGITIREPGDSTRWLATNLTNPFSDAPKMRAQLLGGTNRTREQEAIISLFYEATKDVAENYYGKEWLINLPISNAFISVSTSGAGLNFRYGYKIADAGWYENASSTLRQASNTNFRTENGLHKSHITLTDVRDNQTIGAIIKNTAGINFSGASYNLQYDLRKVSKSQYLEDGDDLHLACSVEQDITNLARAIVRISDPIELALTIDIPSTTGWFLDRQSNRIDWVSSSTGIPSSYQEFWLAMGATFDQLNAFSSLYPYNTNLGLAPQRVTYLDLIQVPIENQLNTYGPFIASGLVHGGTSVIRDDSLAPWTYGGVTNMNNAGVALSNMSLMNKLVIDTASFTVAGLPEYNIGDLLGDNANITALNMNLGTDGLTTSYSLQTFISPLTRMSKILNYKVDELVTLTNKIKKDVVNLDEYISRFGKDEEEPNFGYLADTPITDKINKSHNGQTFIGQSNFTRST